jgi:hypothetical protein
MEEMMYGSLFGQWPRTHKLEKLECEDSVTSDKLELIENEAVISSKCVDTYVNFCNGSTIHQLAETSGVAKSVIWTRILNTTEHLPFEVIPDGFWKRIIFDEEIWKLQQEWNEQLHPILGYSLKEINQVIEQRIEEISLDEDDLYGMLKFVKEFSKRARFQKNTISK